MLESCFGELLLIRPLNSGNCQRIVIPAEAGIQSVVALKNVGLGPSRRWDDGTLFNGRINQNPVVPAKAGIQVFVTC